MDTELRECLNRLEALNDTLGRSRFSYLTKEAERKHFEASLVRNAAGKSHAEKLVSAQSSEQWLRFHKDLARLESVYEFQKFKMEILNKEYLAIYATYKVESDHLKKG